jgi:hypothetical protein
MNGGGSSSTASGGEGGLAPGAGDLNGCQVVDDHGGSGGQTSTNPIDDDVKPFLEHAELDEYALGLDLMTMTCEAADTVIDGSGASGWIKACAKEMFRYLQGCVVQTLPEGVKNDIKQHGLVSTHGYKYYKSNQLDHAAGQTVQYDSPAAKALQVWFTDLCQQINVLYGQCGKPVGKGGHDRRGVPHRDTETTQGLRALAQEYTMFQIVVGPFILYWYGESGMQVRVIEHSVLSRCVHHASSYGGGVSISLIVTCQLIS